MSDHSLVGLVLKLREIASDGRIWRQLVLNNMSCEVLTSDQRGAVPCNASGVAVAACRTLQRGHL